MDNQRSKDLDESAQLRDRLSTMPDEILCSIFELICPCHTFPSSEDTIIAPFDEEISRLRAQLAALCLVSKQFRNIVQPMLFRSVTLASQDWFPNHENLPAFLGTLLNDPSLGQEIQSIYLSNDAISLDMMHGLVRHKCDKSVKSYLSESRRRTGPDTQENGENIRRTFEMMEPWIEIKDPSYVRPSLWNKPLMATLLLAPRVRKLVFDCNVPMLLDEAEGQELQHLKVMHLIGRTALWQFKDASILRAAPKLEVLHCLGSMGFEYQGPFNFPPLSHLRKLVIEGPSHGDMKTIVEKCPLLDDIEYYRSSLSRLEDTDVGSLMDAFEPGRDRIRRLIIVHLPVAFNDVGSLCQKFDTTREYDQEEMVKIEQLRRLREFTKLEFLGLDCTTVFSAEPGETYCPHFFEDYFKRILPPSVHTLRLFYGHIPVWREVDVFSTAHPALKSVIIGVWQYVDGSAIDDDEYLGHFNIENPKNLEITWLFDGVGVVASDRLRWEPEVKDSKFPQVDGF